MSSNQYGLPLTSPSKQTLIPIMQPSGRVFGFFPITDTTFAGTETSFTLSDGTIPITTVTLAPKVSTNTEEAFRVQQFMVAQWPANQEALRPWIAFSELVSVDIPNTTGYYSWWSMPVTMWFHHFGRGVLWNSLKFNLEKYVYHAPSAPSAPPVTTPQTLNWSTTLNAQAFGSECAFFDFNWVDLFKTSFTVDSTEAGNTVVPLDIQITSNPAGGYFKASKLQSQGQTIYPGGGITYNTIRILRLQDPPAASYTFNFTISANVNGTVVTSNAVLTLVVT